MIIKRIPAGIYAANCYVVADETTKETAVIDPGGDSDDIIQTIESIGGKVKFILITHGHADHTGAVIELRRKYEVPVYINEKDEKLINDGAYIFENISDSGETNDHLYENLILKLGSEEIRCIETPGHSPGGICLFIQNTVFTGDTLFNGSIGRTDLAGGDYQTIIASIKNKLLVLPKDTVVLPGHGPQSSIEREERENPFF